MRFALLGSFALFVAAVVAAPVQETNAQRLARGLPPLPPVARSPDWSGRKSLPMVSRGLLNSLPPSPF